MNSLVTKVVIAAFIFWMTIGNGWNEIKLFAAELLPIRYVRVGGVFQYIGKEALREKLLPEVKTSFITADMEEISSVAESMQWVEKAEVRRVWPDTLDIRIHEQKPVYRWGNDGLLNEKGKLFKPQFRERFEDFPWITGPEGKEKRLFKLMNEMSSSIAGYGYGIEEFHVTERRSWRLILTNGIEMELGRKEPLAGFYRFLRVLSVLEADKVGLIAKVDMRYPNGFTVTWKEGEIPDWSKQYQSSEKKG